MQTDRLLSLFQILDELPRFLAKFELADKFLRDAVSFGPVANDTEDVVLCEKLQK